jgi:hypothetical protein
VELSQHPETQDIVLCDSSVKSGFEVQQELEFCDVVGPAAHQVLGHAVTKKIYEAWDNMIGQVAKLASCCLTSQVPLTTSLTHVCSTTYGKGEWTKKTVKWIASFLRNRYRSIAIDGFWS